MLKYNNYHRGCFFAAKIISSGVAGVIHAASDFVQRPLYLTCVYRTGVGMDTGDIVCCLVGLFHIGNWNS